MYTFDIPVDLGTLPVIDKYENKYTTMSRMQ